MNATHSQIKFTVSALNCTPSAVSKMSIVHATDTQHQNTCFEIKRLQQKLVCERLLTAASPSCLLHLQLAGI
jgi:hypothetical protein